MHCLRAFGFAWCFFRLLYVCVSHTLCVQPVKRSFPEALRLYSRRPSRHRPSLLFSGTKSAIYNPGFELVSAWVMCACLVFALS